MGENESTDMGRRKAGVLWNMAVLDYMFSSDRFYVSKYTSTKQTTVNISFSSKF